VRVVPSCLLEPIWNQFSVLLPQQPIFHPNHPLGCHRRRIPDRVVFDHIVAALVHGSGYERLTSPGCSDRTIRRRLKQWAAAGLAEQLHALTLQAYDQIIGLHLADIPTDGCITKAPGGGEVAGRSPVDRGKQGRKRSVATDAAGIPLGLVATRANRNDSPLLGPTLHAAITQVGAMPAQITAHLDRGYDNASTRRLLATLGIRGEIARKGVPAPVQADRRWVVERTHAWINGYGKLRRCTERDGEIVDFYLYLAAAFVSSADSSSKPEHATAGPPALPPSASSDHQSPGALRYGQAGPLPVARSFERYSRAGTARSAPSPPT
jgi:transposase